MSEQWFPQLKEWIHSNGGEVHPSLTIQDTTSSSCTSSPIDQEESTTKKSGDDNDNNNNSTNTSESNNSGRGVFATNDISKGELLILLTSNVVISGESLPQFYHKTSRDDVNNDEKGEEISGRIQPALKRQKVNASPWLRCISAFIIASTNQEEEKLNRSIINSTATATATCFKPYMDSLPTSYDTLLQESSWSNDEIDNVLNGTTLGKMVLQDRQSKKLKERYEHRIYPYLQYNRIIHPSTSNGSSNNNNDDDDDDDNNNNKRDEYYYNLFQKACACISTRGFHLKNNDNGSDEMKNTNAKLYSGPFLLPFIDLLNHSSSPSIKCTTLQRGIYPRDTKIISSSPLSPSSQSLPSSSSSNESFFMIAERDIKKGEEIFHSYGDDLTSTQLLQTFGFVEDRYIQRAIQVSHNTTSLPTKMEGIKNNVYADENNMNLTPAILSKAQIIQACNNVRKSTFPETVKKTLLDRRNQQQDIAEFHIDEEDVDEFWDLPKDVKCRERDTVDVIPDELLIQYHNTDGGGGGEQNIDMLSDELVTLCVIQFLPDEAYNELLIEVGEGDKSSSVCLVERDVLEDYFLGKLVCKAILDAIEERMKEYHAIKVERAKYNLEGLPNHKVQADQTMLQQLLSNKKSETWSVKEQHLLYGLTIRIEEKMCLMMLKKVVVELLDSLDDDEA